ncbi:hypothetical protein G9A89_023380 [Geosiphon pyriformis]|nr:hypothetical protein G9A89_023380 [Geosiphon pyriformis]
MLRSFVPVSVPLAVFCCEVMLSEVLNTFVNLIILSVASTKKFTPDHEWVSLKENEATVGITHHAQASLGDVVFVELPTLNKAVEKSETIGTVESVKAASDIYAPVSGDIIEVNESLKDKTFLINESPEDEGWICKIKISKASEIDELLDEEAYKKIIEPTIEFQHNCETCGSMMKADNRCEITLFRPFDFFNHLNELVGDLYKETEQIRRDSKKLYNRLKSIDEDSRFVSEIASLLPNFPAVANERCGTWYVVPDRLFPQTVYFKSTDGHNGKWSFNLRRFNSHLIDIISKHGGDTFTQSFRYRSIVVDSTRRGKRISDALSKTIPIWCSTINQAIDNFRHQNSLSPISEKLQSEGISIDESSDEIPWDIEFHSPPSTVSKSEHDQIAAMIPRFAEKLLACSSRFNSGINIAELSSKLLKPLRPIWVTPDSKIYANGPPDYTQLSFFPVICLNASQMVEPGMGHRQGYTYIQGAADDHEMWALGLIPALFWKHRKEILEKASNDLVNYEITVKNLFKITNLKTSDFFSNGTCNFLGNTNIAIGNRNSGRPPLCWEIFDHVVNCTPEDYELKLKIKSKIQLISTISEDGKYLQLPIPEGKKGQNVLFEMIPKALEYLCEPLFQSKKVLIHCEQGIDRSVGIALAVLINFFDEEEQYIDGGINHKVVTKELVQRRLLFITSFHKKANPTRATLKKFQKPFIYYYHSRMQCPNAHRHQTIAGQGGGQPGIPHPEISSLNPPKEKVTKYVKKFGAPKPPLIDHAKVTRLPEAVSDYDPDEPLSTATEGEPLDQNEEEKESEDGEYRECGKGEGETRVGAVKNLAESSLPGTDSATVERGISGSGGYGQTSRELHRALGKKLHAELGQ